jgi:hypothetical protein
MKESKNSFPSFILDGKRISFPEKLKSTFTEEERNLVEKSRKNPSPNRIERFLLPDAPVISGAHTFAGYKNVGGRDFYLFGDYHGGGVTTCKRDRAERFRPVIEILKEAFSTPLEDGRKADFFFERLFMNSTSDAEVTRKYSHWSQPVKGKNAPSGKSARVIEEAFSRCLIPSKKECSKTPYGSKTRFHYVDVRQSVDKRFEIHLSILTHLPSLGGFYLSRLEKVSQRVSLSGPESALIQFVAKISPRVLTTYASALMSGYLQTLGTGASSIPEHRSFMKSVMGGDPWIYKEMSKILVHGESQLVFIRPDLAERVTKQIAASSEQGPILRWTDYGIGRVIGEASRFRTSRAISYSELEGYTISRYISPQEDGNVNLFDLAEVVYPGVELPPSVARSLAGAILDYIDIVFLEFDSKLIFDTYTAARIFKPSIELDGGEVWLYAGATHTHNIRILIEHFLPQNMRKTPFIEGKVFDPSSCSSGVPGACSGYSIGSISKCLRVVKGAAVVTD